MRSLLVLLLFVLLLPANDLKTCQSCHPIIYQEFTQSMHQKSIPKKDPIHQAIWQKHPAHAKGEYTCAKCHAPQTSSPDPEHGITCISCHTIIDIKEHPHANENIYESKDKTLYSAQKGMENQKITYEEKSSWFGLVKTSKGSPYHDIDYRNKGFYTGAVCMGCHSHKQNNKGFDLCRIDAKGASNTQENCISCHMPKVQGSATTIQESRTHAFHGFAGVHVAPKMLAKYLDLTYQKNDQNFTITIHNRAPHPLLSHPLREVILKVRYKHQGKWQTLPIHTFKKVIGDQGKPSMPWLATETIQDNMIQANERRTIPFDKTLTQGDEIEINIGYHIVNPKTAQKLKIDPKFSEFIPLKRSYYKIP